MTKKTHPPLLLRNKLSCYNKNLTSTSTHHLSTHQQREEGHPQLKAHNQIISKSNLQPSKCRIDSFHLLILLSRHLIELNIEER